MTNAWTMFFEGMNFIPKRKAKKTETEWKCPINYEGCKENCGSYCCGN